MQSINSGCALVVDNDGSPNPNLGYILKLSKNQVE